MTDHAPETPATCGDCSYFVPGSGPKGECRPPKSASQDDVAGTVYAHEEACADPGPSRPAPPLPSREDVERAVDDLGTYCYQEGVSESLRGPYSPVTRILDARKRSDAARARLLSLIFPETKP